jgi:hypothetical protein
MIAFTVWWNPRGNSVDPDGYVGWSSGFHDGETISTDEICRKFSREVLGVEMDYAALTRELETRDSGLAIGWDTE